MHAARPPKYPKWLVDIHNECLRYRAAVRAELDVTEEEGERFMEYAKVCYSLGIATDKDWNNASR